MPTAILTLAMSVNISITLLCQTTRNGSAGTCWRTLEFIYPNFIRNFETTEHCNKVLKGILVRLQGFANRCISKYRHHEFTSSTVLNHLGFVIQEHLIQFYHNFDTVVPRKKPTHCGLCDGMDHNARSCSMQCPICEKGYYVGHTKAKCEKATAGNDS